MRLLLLAALALLSTTGPVGHAQTPPGEVPSSRTGTASISGRILATDSTAIRNARVGLNSAAGMVPTVLSDSEGRFAFTSLADGRYTLSVTKAGYVSTTFGARRTGDPAIPFDVANGAIIDGVVMRLPKAAAVSGRVVDDLGDPVMRIPVVAEMLVDAGARKTLVVAGVQTDDLGRFRIGGLLAGQFLVSAGTGPIAVLSDEAANTSPEPGNALQTRSYYPSATTPGGAQPLSLSSGEERSAIDLVVPQSRLLNVVPSNVELASNAADTGAIRGRILRADGRPIRGAHIRIVNDFQVTESDEDGAYEFAGVSPGAYSLLASKEGFLSAELGRRLPSERGQMVRVEPGKAREHIDITLPRYGAIEGRLLDENGEPMEGVRVRALRLRFVGGRRRLENVAGAPGSSGLTDDLGRYRISELAPGQYFLGSLSGQVMTYVWMADVPGYLPTYFPGTVNASEARAIAVGVAQEISGIDFIPARGATARIAGIATTSSGDPIQDGLTMSASERSGALVAVTVRARIDRDGRFEFPNVPPGEYVIRAVKDRVNPWTEGEFASQFVVVNGTDVTGLILRTSPGSTISGRVTLESSGTFSPRFAVLAPIPVDPDRSSDQTARAETGDDWTFAMAGISGPRRLRADFPNGWALKAIYVNGIDVTDTPIVFGTAAQSLRDVEVVLTDRVAEISGRVTASDDCELPDCSAIVFATDRERWYQDSRFVDRSPLVGDGAFLFKGLPPGEYFVAAVGPRPASEGSDAWQDPAFLDAIAGQATRVVLGESQKIEISVKLVRSVRRLSP